MLQALLPIVGPLLEKLIPDPNAAAEAKLKMLELAQKGELTVLDADLKLALGQMEINKEEAKAGPFRGGWRPATGWVCVFGLAYQFLVQPILPWIFQVIGVNAPPLPSIDSTALFALLGSLLGFGGFRTFERIKGKA